MRISSLVGRILGASTLLGAACIVAATERPAYRLFFPHLSLRPDEQIEGFNLSVSCGHIEAVTSIPWDWNIQITRAVSEVEELKASAGHGISYKKQLNEFSGAIRISSRLPDCFDVTATVNAVFDNDRVIKLSRQQLRLIR